MGALRHARSFGNEMSPSPGALGSQQQQPMSYPLGSTPQGFYVPNVHQGLPTLIVMIVVLMIILLFCFWGAPAVRSFCKQKICCFCPMDEPDMDHGYTATPATPTIILLPFGRMLVVDRRIFTQLQANYSGIDFMELSANLIRNRHYFSDSSGSVLDSECAYKMRSTSGSLDCFPPSYEDIYGPKHCDLPPSYSQLSMMLKNSERKQSNGEVIIDITNSNGIEERTGFRWYRSFWSVGGSVSNIYQSTRFIRNARSSRSMNDIPRGFAVVRESGERALSSAEFVGMEVSRPGFYRIPPINGHNSVSISKKCPPIFSSNEESGIHPSNCPCPSTSAVTPSMKDTLSDTSLKSPDKDVRNFKGSPSMKENPQRHVDAQIPSSSQANQTVDYTRSVNDKNMSNEVLRETYLYENCENTNRRVKDWNEHIDDVEQNEETKSDVSFNDLSETKMNSEVTSTQCVDGCRKIQSDIVMSNEAGATTKQIIERETCL